MACEYGSEERRCVPLSAVGWVHTQIEKPYFVAAIDGDRERDGLSIAANLEQLLTFFEHAMADGARRYQWNRGGAGP